MSDMKCPICNDGKIITYPDGTYECDNHECSIYNGTHTETFEALIRTRKALDYCIERFKSLENVLDEKAEASDIPDNPDLYAWAVRIKPIWGELKEITGIDYTTEHK